jgi:hypothetical protein
MIRAWLNVPIRTNADNQRIGAPLMYLETHGLDITRVSIVNTARHRGAEPAYKLTLWVEHPTMTQHLFERLLFTLAELLHVGYVQAVFPNEPAENYLGRGILVGPTAAQNLFDPAKFTI